MFQVRLKVLDVDDERPQPRRPFYQFEVLESAAVGSEVGRLAADDPDTDAAQLSFYWVEPVALFSLEEHSGIIRVRTPLDGDHISVFRLRARVSDGQRYSSPVAVTIRIGDVNDNSPRFVPSDGYNFILPEGEHRSRFVGRVLAVDVDVGDNAVVEYALENSTESQSRRLFQLNSKTGVLTVDGALDRETVGIARTLNRNVLHPML